MNPIPPKVELVIELKDSCNDCRCCFGYRFFRKKQPENIRTDDHVLIDTEIKTNNSFNNIMSKSGASFSDNE